MEPKSKDPLDPKTLIADSYAMENVVIEECRSIFLDWALSLPPSTTAQCAAKELLKRYGAAYPDHPMTLVLQDALIAPPTPKRRGGRHARLNRFS